MKLTAIVANPKPASRTHQLAEGVASRIAGPAADVEVHDLALVSSELFDWGSAPVRALVERVQTSDVLVFASPTYKAGTTGLMKAFIDRLPADSLERAVTVAVHTGGGPQHSLSTAFTLAPLLSELGAIVVATRYLVVDDATDIGAAAADVAARFSSAVGRVAAVAAETPAAPGA